VPPHKMGTTLATATKRVKRTAGARAAVAGRGPLRESRSSRS
jgi:hypothetical protein